ncbi:PqqD family protein [Nocardia sp. BMG51109]|uniref:PqqD family protein n=1 Tax=Nocardia sp. BMG51109 TaxID=1056816 RepID=UPI0004BA6730|nr:PqqD family protein [Nocardia sp. BMG51109]
MNTPSPTMPTAAAASVTRTGDMWTLVPSTADGEVLVVNHTGHQIFQHCDGRHSASDIAHELAEMTGVSADDVIEDVTRFVHRLAAAGLVAR